MKQNEQVPVGFEPTPQEGFIPRAISLIESPWLGRPQALVEKLLLLLYEMGMMYLPNSLLNACVFTHRLLSVWPEKLLFCSGK